MNRTEKIKPCPFCGSIKVNICRTNKYACWVECIKCYGSTDSGKTRKEAIQSWNRRAKYKDSAYAKIFQDNDNDKDF